MIILFISQINLEPEIPCQKYCERMSDERELQVVLERLSDDRVGSLQRELRRIQGRRTPSTRDISSDDTSEESFPVYDHQAMDGLRDLVTTFEANHDEEDNVAFKRLFVEKWAEEQVKFNLEHKDDPDDPDQYILKAQMEIM